MVNDTTGDFLIRIKNGYLAHKQSVSIPYSTMTYQLGLLLVKEGYIKNIDKVKQESKNKKSKQSIMNLVATLTYDGSTPAMENVVRISKPGIRIYVKTNTIPTVLSGFGTVFISTSKGLMTGKEAKKQKLGGELICKIW
jgi:small subunit ribosomal protein S8